MRTCPVNFAGFGKKLKISQLFDKLGKVDINNIRRLGDSFVEIFDKIDVEIEFDRVVRNLGGSIAYNSSPSPTMVKLIHQEIEEGYSLIHPRAVYDEVAAHLTEAGKVALGDGFTLNIPHIDREWRGLERVSLAICTIGQELDKRVSQFSAQGDYTASIALDSVGRAALSSICNKIDSMVCERAGERGMVAGPRFEPGAVGWELAEQTVLFSLLPAEKIGVRLNECYQMFPLKSVSLVIGMGSETPIPRGRRPCWYCNLLDCPGRDPAAVK